METLRDIVLDQLKSLKPSFISKKPHFNFISAHYFWIIGLIIVGSVIIYGGGTNNLAYIDALFFASGANTQAGLNTVNVNNLNTFQQVMLYLLPMLTNPITINSFVVFLRLYWFEKRFQHIVKEARQRRGTLSRSKAKAQLDLSNAERGVDGRHITIMHGGSGKQPRITNDGILLDDPGNSFPGKDVDFQSSNGHANENGMIPKRGSEGEGEDEDDGEDEVPPTEVWSENRRPEITFAPTVKRSDGLEDDEVKLPPSRTDEEHIAILQRQRNGDDEILRIPGPREAEQGALPSRIQAGDGGEVEPDRARRVYSEEPAPPPAAAENRPQAITITEPTKPREEESTREDIIERARIAARVFSFLRIRKPRFLSRRGNKYHHDEDELHARPSMSRRRTLETIRTAFSRDKEDMAPYLSWQPTLGRNSAFPDLTEEQREELGGIEYRSLKTLALVLIFYFWGFQILGVIILLPWIMRDSYFGAVVDAIDQGRTWWGFFTPNSAFTDLGFTLTPDSMNSFNTAVLPMIFMSFLIVVGNTGFPVMLRFIIWVASIFTPRGSGLWEELRFLLDHPRRCFTLLFPSGATWWLFWLLVILNGIDVILFIILDLGSGPIAELPGGIKVLDGLFQATSTRTAGFSCVNLADLHPGVQVSYLIMMYISVFPIAISVRRTNVYEEKSLGIYQKHEVDEVVDSSDLSYVGAHLRRQLSFDLWYIFIGFFILSISEGSRIMANDFSMFAILFEIVSAYGTVGMSLGYPTTDASLSSQFSVIGKLVIIAMMIRGRHRGLPYGLDRAILLPSESLLTKEAADADARIVRQASHNSAMTNRSRPRSRNRSVDHRNSRIIASLLQPGPAKPHEPSPMGLRRRFSDPASEEDGPDVTKITAAETSALPRLRSSAL